MAKQSEEPVKTEGSDRAKADKTPIDLKDIQAIQLIASISDLGPDKPNDFVVYDLKEAKITSGAIRQARKLLGK